MPAMRFSCPLLLSSVVVFLLAMALGQADQATFARRVDGAVLAAGPQVDEDGVHVADGGRIADHVAEAPQLGDLGLVEAGFARDEVSARSHRDARRLDRLLERHVVIHRKPGPGGTASPETSCDAQAGAKLNTVKPSTSSDL